MVCRSEARGMLRFLQRAEDCSQALTLEDLRQVTTIDSRAIVFLESFKFLDHPG